MRVREAIVIGAAALVLGMAPAAAQTFRSFQCADGSRLSVGFLPSDKQAHVQLDGTEVLLKKRLSFAGDRYRASGITLFLTSEGAVLTRGGKTTACTPV